MVQDNPSIEQVKLEEAPDFEHTFSQFPKLEAVSPEQHTELEQLTPQQRIDNAFEITPKKRLVDQNNPTGWGLTEAIREHGGGSQQLESDISDNVQQGSNFPPGKELYAEPIGTKPTNYEQIRDMLHDLRVKFMGDPEKWSTKEEVGNFINQAMSVMGAGVRMPKGGIVPSRPPGKLNAEGIQKIKDLVAEGKSVKEIAQELDVVPNSIYVKIREQGIRAPGLDSIKIPPNEGTFTERLSSKIATTLPNKNNLAAADYPHMQRQFLTTLDKGITTREGIAGELQISPYQVTQLAQRFGLDFKLPVGKAKPTVSEEVTTPNRNWTPERDSQLLRHINDGLSYSEAGALLGLTRGQVAGRRHRLK